MNYTGPEQRAYLEAPGLRSRLKVAIEEGHIPAHHAEQMGKDFHQMARALNGGRVAPTPFAPREELPAPPGSDEYNVRRRVVENLQAAEMAERLQTRMGTDATQTDYRAPPTLREQVAASFDAHVGNTGD